MSFDVNQFVAEIQKHSFARTSDFQVEITGDILQKLGGGLDFSSSLAFRINSVTLPQRSVTATSYIDFGAPYKIGTHLNYVDVEFQIICSPDLREREFFMRWQDLIGGRHREGNASSEDRKADFRTGYYDDYVAQKGVSIYQLDQSGFKTYAVDLIEAYPINVGSLSMSWNQTDVQTMNVTMTYRYFEERSQGQLGTQLRVGIDGVQIAGLGRIPFNKTVWRQKLDPRNIATGIAREGRDILKRSGVNLHGF